MAGYGTSAYGTVPYGGSEDTASGPPPTPGWHVDISIGVSSGAWVHTWAIDEAKGDVPDDALILDGLNFGWLMSKPWPNQPDPTVASLGINVPNFTDYADIQDGDPIAIEVHLVNGGPLWASFYGRVTDAQGVPRPGKRHGVTLAVTAVDYTVDVTEVPDAIPAGGSANDFMIVKAAFVNACGGPLPAPGFDDPPDIWTGTLPIEITPLGGASSSRARLDIVLDTAVTLNGTSDGPQSRMILAPLIDSDGFLADAGSGRNFTLDTIDVGGGVAIDVDGAQLARSMTWSRAKGNVPTQTIVNYDDTGTASTATYSQPGAVAPLISQQIDTWLDGLDAAAGYPEIVAIFYTPPLPSATTWQAKSLTWLLHLLDDTTLETLPSPFPDWTAAESDGARWACYNARISATDVDDTCTPDGTDAFAGLLLGASLTITGGRISVTPTIRLT